MKKRATIADVARAAGVSTATVSYIINEIPNQSIPEATVRRVREAVEKLQYRRNDAARALKSNKTNCVGISLNYSMASLSKRSHAMSLQSTFLALKAAGKYVCLAMEENSSGKMTDCVDFYLSGKVDGILLFGGAFDALDSSSEDKIVELGIPCVVHNMEAGRNISSVNIDFFGGAYNMTKRLIQDGAKRIIYFRTERDTRIDRERQQAIRRAAYELGTPTETVIAKYVNDTPSDDGTGLPTTQSWYGGYLEMCRVINGLKPDDALIVGWSDHLEYAIEAEHELKKTAHIGVLSHIADSLRPVPGVLYDCIPMEMIGRACVELLLQQIDGNHEVVHRLIESYIC